MTLRVRRLDPRSRLPARADPDDAGYDLHAVEEIVLPAGGRAKVRTGIAIELPAEHAGWVVPRSGLAARHGIALVNAPGLIDSGYRGEVAVLLLNTDAVADFTVRVGMRIAQLVVSPVATPDVVEVDTLRESVRADRGFGSSGM